MSNIYWYYIRIAFLLYDIACLYIAFTKPTEYFAASTHISILNDILNDDKKKAKIVFGTIEILIYQKLYSVHE